MSGEIFANNLIKVRKRLGWSQEEVAEAINVTRQTIIKYEKGELNPSMETVFRLSDKLKIPVDYFFRENTEIDEFLLGYTIIDISDINYRERDKLDDDTDKIVKEATFKIIRKLLIVEDLTKQSIQFKNPIKNLLIRNKHDAEKAAKEIRKKWGLWDNPIVNVIAILEGKGIRVVEIKIQENFQGLSAMVGQIPVIVLNTTVKESTRRRYTALHELAHLLLWIEDTISAGDKEKICDAFAAAMLIPKELLLTELGGKRSHISKEELIKIKEKYGISFKALLVGAAFAQIITWEKYKTLLEDIEFLADLGQYPFNERTLRFEQLLLFGIAEGMISNDKAAELSGITLDEIKQLQANLIPL
jgi:Zn-dependent peptidase ImmA (M78 family)/DNA-binding XRE family transcriptional regulator